MKGERARIYDRKLDLRQPLTANLAPFRMSKMQEISRLGLIRVKNYRTENVPWNAMNTDTHQNLAKSEQKRQLVY